MEGYKGVAIRVAVIATLPYTSSARSAGVLDSIRCSTEIFIVEVLMSSDDLGSGGQRPSSAAGVTEDAFRTLSF